ncbi:MAG: bifunctional diguanylate cyclase/phosphodiesterase [bacterium]
MKKQARQEGSGDRRRPLVGIVCADPDLRRRLAELVASLNARAKEIDPAAVATGAGRPAHLILAEAGAGNVDSWVEQFPTLVLSPAADAEEGAALLALGAVDVVAPGAHDTVLAQRIARALGDPDRRSRAASNAAGGDTSEFDPLTGVFTLSAFRRDVRNAVGRARRSGRTVAVAILDFDRFAHVNEVHGHDVGDRILRESARRLSTTLRDTDTVARFHPEHCAVSRVGGDRFAALLEGLGDSQSAGVITRRMIDALEEPFEIDDVEIRLSARAGVSLYPHDGLDTSALLRNAEAAASREPRSAPADSATPAGIRFFSAEVARHHRQELELERSLRAATVDDTFGLEYQPKIALRDESIVGFEALLRHRHEGKPVPAQEVIALAERTNLIRDLGLAIFRRVCVDAERLRAATGRSVRLFTNFSPRQMESPHWLTDVLGVLDATGVDTSLVGIEITETVFLKDHATITRSLERLAERGLEISLDDFGTGYSSLSYLTRLPLHELKIDRSFIAGISDSRQESREIAGLIVTLGRTLDLRVVAEGTEDEPQLDLLRAIGCTAAQGYFYARPRPLETFFVELRRGRLATPGGLF